MCGIIGIVSPEDPLGASVVASAAATLRHRGPDDHGIMSHGECVLAHRRLSILDLSPAGHQPMQVEDLPVWITFNGEIYNYLDLKQRLEGLGWRFQSNTDTEVIAKGYVQWGVEVFRLLRGMFALGIWDGRERKLILARDSFAIKPLYYVILSHGGLAFASELKALLALGVVTKEINWSALAQFLRYQAVPEPQSIYATVKRLPAHHYLIWKAGRVQIQTQGAPADKVSGAAPTEEEALATLEKSVACHMIADVPVGAFLSGGVDSSLIVALMRRVTQSPIHTFSIVFEGSRDFDESAYARLVAQHVGVEHHELAINSSLLSDTPAILGFYDEPFANPAALIASALSRFTRQYVTVALSGVGGDEFFGGYPRYLAFSWLSWVRILGPLGAKIGAGLLDWIPTSTDRKRTTDRARRLFAAIDDAACFYDDLSSYATPAMTSLVLSRDLLPAISFRDPNRIATTIGEPQWAMDSDIMSYLPSDLLTYTDRSSMAHSLEVRTPLVDREIAALSRRLTYGQKFRGLQSKRLLKRIAARLVPRAAIYRKKKGFAVPILDWLRRDLNSLFIEMLSLERLRSAPELDPKGVNALVERHRNGDNSIAYLLWSLFIYMLWREQHLTARHPTTPQIWP